MILFAIIVGILCVIAITFTAWVMWEGGAHRETTTTGVGSRSSRYGRGIGPRGVPPTFPSAEREDIKELRKEICRLQKAQDNGTKFSQEPAEPEGPELDLIL